LYVAYHDNEWGVPVKDDPTLFEFLMLETFQAGLSWITVLKKREHFSSAFDGFDYQKIAKYNTQKLEQLMRNSSIIRNKLKIKAAVTNAIAFINIQNEWGSFSKYIWHFTDDTPVVNRWVKLSDIPAQTALSITISNDLKKRGFKFVGPTVVYAHMQATGMVNDHLLSCFRHSACQEF
jgi:DNA-3-methyladenine glycosylase I